MASYDTYDRNNNGFMGYEVEKGNYSLSLRTDVHNKKENSKLMNSYLENTFQVAGEGYRYETDEVTGNKVENRFTTYTNATSGASSTCVEPQTKYALSIDGKDNNVNYNQEITYLTRSDFKTTFPVSTDTRKMTSEMYNNVFVVHDPFVNDEDVMPYNRFNCYKSYIR